MRHGDSSIVLGAAAIFLVLVLGAWCGSTVSRIDRLERDQCVASGRRWVVVRRVVWGHSVHDVRGCR